MKAALEALTKMPGVARPPGGRLPDELVNQGDSDLAGRSLFSALVYVLLWLLLVAFTDCFRILPWTSAASGALLVLIALGRMLLGSNFERWHGAHPGRWRMAFDLGVIASAAVWASLCTSLVAQQGLGGDSMVALLATAGIAAGGSTSLAPRLALVRGFLALLLVPLILLTLFQGGKSGQGVALMVAVYLAFLLIAVRRMHGEYWLALHNSWLLDRRAAELEQARDRAMAASRAKDEFLATMSHELRTPLNAILGFSELLGEQGETLLSDEQREYVGHISGSGAHLLELINDILDLAKSDAGQLDLERTPLDADALCQSSLNLVRAQAASKKIRLRYEPAVVSPRVSGDERRVRQILVNLLGNAVKFTPDNGEVSLSVENVSPGEVRFNVDDTGIGIRAEDQKRLFQPFVQLDSSITRKYAGTGLGLALSMRLAHLHGGRLEVQSEPGRGSRFTLVLPCRPGAAKPVV